MTDGHEPQTQQLQTPADQRDRASQNLGADRSDPEHSNIRFNRGLIFSGIAICSMKSLEDDMEWQLIEFAPLQTVVLLRWDQPFSGKRHEEPAIYLNKYWPLSRQFWQDWWSINDDGSLSGPIIGRAIAWRNAPPDFVFVPPPSEWVRPLDERLSDGNKEHLIEEYNYRLG